MLGEVRGGGQRTGALNRMCFASMDEAPIEGWGGRKGPERGGGGEEGLLHVSAFLQTLWRRGSGRRKQRLLGGQSVVVDGKTGLNFRLANPGFPARSFALWRHVLEMSASRSLSCKPRF